MHSKLWSQPKETQHDQQFPIRLPFKIAENLENNGVDNKDKKRDLLQAYQDCQ